MTEDAKKDYFAVQLTRDELVGLKSELMKGAMEGARMAVEETMGKLLWWIRALFILSAGCWTAFWVSFVVLQYLKG